MKKFIIFAVLVALVLSGCGSYSPLAKKTLGGIDKVQIILAGGNPEYGFKSKVFTKEDEISELVDAVTSATIREKVKDDDIKASNVSKLVFFTKDEVVASISFNGNDSLRVWSENAFYYVAYDKKTPYEIYEESDEEVIIVDQKIKEEF